VLILQNRFYSLAELDRQVKHKFSYLSWDDIKDIWIKKRNLLRDKKFIQALFDFDVRGVTQAQLTHLERLYENDRWMEFGLIQRESNFAAQLYGWTQSLIEFMKVARQLLQIGVVKYEEEIKASESRVERIGVLLESPRIQWRERRHGGA